jgi:hypothetical protein
MERAAFVSMLRNGLSFETIIRGHAISTRSFWKNIAISCVEVAMSCVLMFNNA